MNMVLTIVIVFCPVQFAEGTELLWPTEVVNGPIPILNASHALGRPIGTMAEFLTGGASATYSSFAGAETFDPAALPTLLGVSEEVLSASDIISFDTYGIQFENSTWTFSSGGLTHIINVPGEALATGAIPDFAFCEFWGLECEDQGESIYFVLLDLGVLSGVSDDFSVEVRAVGGAYGRPEIEAIGLLSNGSVPVENTSLSRIKALYR